MELHGLRTSIVKLGDDLVGIILRALEENGLRLEDNDVLVIATKVVSIMEGRTVNVNSVKASKQARIWATKYDLEPGCAELVKRESQRIYGGVTRALLTLKDNILVANAGIDHSNVPEGNLVLWPKSTQRSAEEIRARLLRATGKKVGVAIVDSRTTPLRMGTVGVALAVAGFRPVKDYRKRKDLFGKAMLITRQAVADDLASAAHLMMGETDESIPVVLVRGAPVEFCDDSDPKSAMITSEDCMFMKNLKPKKLLK